MMGIALLVLLVAAAPLALAAHRVRLVVVTLHQAPVTLLVALVVGRALQVHGDTAHRAVHTVEAVLRVRGDMVLLAVPMVDLVHQVLGDMVPRAAHTAEAVLRVLGDMVLLAGVLPLLVMAEAQVVVTTMKTMTMMIVMSLLVLAEAGVIIA